MRKLIVAPCLSLLILILFCCTKTKSSPALIAQYSEESAMAHYLVEPDRALEIIDSALLIDNITPQRADYLRAIIYSSSNNTQEGFRICQRLIDDESWKSLPDSEDVISFQVDLYRLMATMATEQGNNLAAIRYAKEGIALSHGVDKLLGDEADFMSRMGYVLCKIGQTEEGLKHIERAKALAESDNTWSSLVSYFNNAKKINNVLNSLQRFDEEKSEVFEALTRLESLRTHISDFMYVPEAIASDSLALEEFIQFFEVQFYCYLTNIYANTSRPDSAQYYLDKVREIPQSADPFITSSLVHPLILMNRNDEAVSLISSIKEVVGNDTINEEYKELLMYEMQIAKNKGDMNEANVLANKIIDLSEQLKSTDLQVMLADAAAQYQLIDERQRREDAESRFARIIIFVIIFVCLVIAALTGLYIRMLLHKHKLLRRMLDKAKRQLEEANIEYEEPDSKIVKLSIEEIYQKAVELVEGERLFRDPLFDINALAKRIPTNRSYLSIAINQMAGMNFRTWVAKYRIEYAKHIIQTNPAITNDNLAEECGFDNRVSLHRQFRKIEGKTPAEYLSELENK